jgi:hypothetical protein
MSNVQIPLPGDSGRQLQAGKHVTDREFLADDSPWEFFDFTTEQAANLANLLDPVGNEVEVARQLEADGVEISSGFTPEAAAFAGALADALGVDL